MVVETDWPVACSGTALSEPSVPVSVQGQQTWVQDIRNVLQNFGSRALGICYWEPGWVGSAALGSSCSVSIFELVVKLSHINGTFSILLSQDNLLVNSNGTTRASINMFSSDM